MLTWMRTHQKTIMTWTLYLVIPSFVLLYGYGQIQRSGEAVWVMRVNDREIVYPELLRQEEELRLRYQQQLGERYEEFMEGRDLRQEAMDSLIERELILTKAQEYGFGVSKTELVESIASIPAFQRDGQFDINLYNYYIWNQYRGNEEYFENLMRQDILRSKMASFVRSTMPRSQAQSEAEYARRNTEARTELLAFRPADYVDEVEVDEDELVKFFDERKEDYRVPEQRKIQYVEYNASDYRNDVEVNENRVEAFFNRNQQKYQTEESRSAEVVLYSVGDYLDQVDPTEDDVQSYFEENQGKYRTQREIKIRFIASPADQWKEEVEITEEELRDSYESNKTRYEHEEQVRARHILLKVAPDADEAKQEEVLSKIQEIRQEIVDGLDFAEAAKKYSEDTGSGERGGDLGFFGKRAMVPEFSETAFSLEPGEISEPVKTQFGYHLIKVEEQKDAYTDSFDDVRDDIRQSIERRKAREVFQEFADDVTSLDEISDEYPVLTSDYFKRGDEVPGIKSTDLSSVFFTAARRDMGSRPEPVFGSDTYYLVELVGENESRLKSFEEAEEAVRKDVRQEQAIRQAMSVAQADLGRVKQGEITWEQLLEEKDKEAINTGPFTRTSNFVRGIGPASRQFTNAAFNLEQEGSIAGPVGSERGAFIFRLTDIDEPHLPELSEVRNEVQQDFIASEAGRLAERAATKLADEAFMSETSITESAQTIGVEVEESEYFKETGPIEPIGTHPEINERAFRMKRIGTVSDVIPVYQQQPRSQQQTEGPVEACYVIALSEIKESYIPELEEVREDVEDDYKLVKAAGIAKEKAQAAVPVLKDQIAAGTPVSATRTVDLESLVPGEEDESAPIDGSYIQPTTITKASPYVQGIGRSIELSKTAFVLKPGQISDVVEVRETKYSEEGEPEKGDVTGYYIMQVLGHEEPGPMLLGQQEQQMEQYWERQTQSLAFEAWIDSVSRAAAIEYNEEILSPADEIPEATEEVEVS